MMQKIIEKNGVELEPDVHNDMEVIMNEMMDAVRRSIWSILSGIFLGQIAQSFANKRQIRWYPALIKWCLHPNLSLPVLIMCYKVLVLSLFHQTARTLFDYSHWIKGEVGFQPKVNDQLLEKVDKANEKKPNMWCWYSMK